MKKVLFLLFVFIVNCSCYSQKINSKGQKMVKKIERLTEDEKEVIGVIDFSYNNRNELCELNVRYKYSGKIMFKKSDNVMIRFDYDTENEMSPIRYVFTFDNNRHIKKQIVDQDRIDGGVLRYIYDYSYKSNSERLSQIFRRTYYSYDRRNFETREGDYILRYFGYQNENVHVSYMMHCEKINGIWCHDFPINWNDRIYSEEFENDTNIDFFELYYNYGSGYNIENMTEWVGCKSKYLIEKSDFCNAEFYYAFDGSDCDNLGNIVKFIVKEYNKHLYTFKIYYCME